MSKSVNPSQTMVSCPTILNRDKKNKKVLAKIGPYMYNIFCGVKIRMPR